MIKLVLPTAPSPMNTHCNKRSVTQSSLIEAKATLILFPLDAGLPLALFRDGESWSLELMIWLWLSQRGINRAYLRCVVLLGRGRFEQG